MMGAVLSDGRLSGADDLLVHQIARPIATVADAAEGWFDRFYFSLHPPTAGTLVVIGAAVYPNTDVIDGYASVACAGTQRNVRFSETLHADRFRTAVGPLRWEVVEPLTAWRLTLDETPEGFALDATWRARSAPWLVEPIAVSHAIGPQTEFAHFFQAGRWEGHLALDGRRIDIGGWLGARDRSWGIRRTRERLGLHLWVIAQFDADCVAVHYNEHRDGRVQHCDGALLSDDGSAIRIIGVRHDLDVDRDGELRAASLSLQLESGQALDLQAEAGHKGLYMDGAGYGGWHGVPRGDHHLEHACWPLDGTRTPRTLSLGLTDKACRFTRAGAEGAGLIELALSRSDSYTNRPSMRCSQT